VTEALTIDEIEARISGKVPIGGAPKSKPWVDLMNDDCRNALKELDDNSVDAVVTDPPYALTDNKKGGSGPASVNLESPYGRARITTGFMGKAWDTGETAFDPGFWQEVMRVLKPGGHVLAFGGSRTYHKIATAIDDAGFEIRDQIMWLYGSGFPKSSNQDGDWEGWGTALKPAHEPIVVARKPLIGTVPANLAKYGVGALNIDGCRVPFSGEADEAESKTKNQHADFGSGPMTNQVFGKFDKDRDNYDPPGRWPANVIHDGSDEVLAAFAQFGESKSRKGSPRGSKTSGDGWGMTKTGAEYDDAGSPARFFYAAKASKADRDEGMTTPPKPVVTFATANGTSGKPSSISEGRNTEYRNTHPTVKPTNLMRYLCRLVTPPNGVVLDPFMGSGSTGRGAILEGFNFIGIEMSPEYFDIADARIEAAEKEFMR
jgi:site-specific DNA-methyltransferase (adenine-specific)